MQYLAPETIKQYQRTSIFSVFVSLLITLFLSACSSGGGGGDDRSTSYVPKLYEAIYGAGAYQYTNEYNITMAPDDVDWDRWGILHDGADSRLYFMKAGTDNTLYQFALNPLSGDYEYGYNSLTPITLTNIPDDADPSSIAMSNVGVVVSTSYYAHMKSLSMDGRIYTFRFNGSVYAYERSYDITGAPADTDWSRWAMLIGDGVSRFYAGSTSDDALIYQFKYNSTTQMYEWGFGGAVASISILYMPADSELSNFSMHSSGVSGYRFYYLNQQ